MRCATDHGGFTNCVRRFEARRGIGEHPDDDKRVDCFQKRAARPGINHQRRARRRPFQLERGTRAMGWIVVSVIWPTPDRLQELAHGRAPVV